MLKRHTPVFVIAAFVLVACGASGVSTGPAGSSGAPGSGSSAGSSTSASIDRDPLVVLYPNDPGTLDPSFGVSPIVMNITNNVLETLASFDESGTLVPVLAESWEVLPDGLTWRFHLREGIEFQNGEPMDAHAVKYSTDRNADPELEAVNDIPERIGLDEVVVVDDYTVDVITLEPTDQVEALLYRWYVLPPEYYGTESLEHLARNPIGTGPYQVTDYVKDDHVTLEAWDGYREGQAAVHDIEFRIVPELSTRVAEMQTGNGDILVNLDPDQLSAITDNPDLRVETVDTLRRIFISINTATPPLDDARVRQAMNYAVDWDAINQSLLDGAGQRMTLPVNGADWVHPGLSPYEFDLEKAKDLMAEAGVTGPIDLELNLASGSFVKSEEISQAIASDLADIGINVEVVPMESSLFREMVNAREANDLFLVGLASQLYGPKDMASFAPEAAWNSTGWPESSERGREWLDLFREMTATFDFEAKQELYLEAAELLYEEAPAIFLWNEIAFYAASTRTDWVPKPLIELQFYNVQWTD